MRRWAVWLMLFIFTVASALVGAYYVTELFRVWDHPDPWARVHVIMCLLCSAIGTLSAGHQLTTDTPPGRIIATCNTLAFKMGGQPEAYFRRDDFVATAIDGSFLVLESGNFCPVFVPGAGRKKNDKFLEQLYAMWWPGVSLPNVRAYLEETDPPETAGFAAFLLSFFLFLLCGILAFTLRWKLLIIAGGLVSLYFVYWFATEARREQAARFERRYPLSPEYVELPEAEYAED